MTPAEELRAAAAKLRETAEHTTPGAWLVPDVPDMVVSDKPMPWGTPIVAECGTPEDAAWISLVHPGLAEPLAEFLEGHADEHAQGCHWTLTDCPMLDVARAINGSQP